MELDTQSETEYESVMEEIRKSGSINEEIKRSNKSHLIIAKCFCTSRNSIPVNVSDLKVIVIPPDITQKGWTYFRTILFGQDDFTAMTDRLKERGFELEILKKSLINNSISSSMLITDTLFSSSTPKQMDAVMMAIKYGYYKVPRGYDIKTIADMEKLKRTTFQHHFEKV